MCTCERKSVSIQSLPFRRVFACCSSMLVDFIFGEPTEKCLFGNKSDYFTTNKPGLRTALVDKGRIKMSKNELPTLTETKKRGSYYRQRGESYALADKLNPYCGAANCKQRSRLSKILVNVRPTRTKVCANKKDVKATLRLSIDDHMLRVLKWLHSCEEHALEAQQYGKSRVPHFHFPLLFVFLTSKMKVKIKRSAKKEGLERSM